MRFDYPRRETRAGRPPSQTSLSFESGFRVSKDRVSGMRGYNFGYQVTELWVSKSRVFCNLILFDVVGFERCRGGAIAP